MLGIDDRTVDWSPRLTRRNVDKLRVTRARNGESGEAQQIFNYVYPGMRATANKGTNTQTRTFGANALCGQGRTELLGRSGSAMLPAESQTKLSSSWPPPTARVA